MSHSNKSTATMDDLKDLITANSDKPWKEFCKEWVEERNALANIKSRTKSQQTRLDHLKKLISSKRQFKSIRTAVLAEGKMLLQQVVEIHQQQSRDFQKTTNLQSETTRE
ncbi:hypothetical protein HDU86_002725 [Geranomyces michiganensis]|nr:hypothetical protein HDU86_002725 [Geranomyces michiganensis]